MPLYIVRNDITRMKTDAIVNAANRTLLGGGGVDGCIHRAAGPQLLAECRTLGGCDTGDAKITGAYRLPCQYVIHTVGPVWNGGGHGERALLISCYQRSLELAAENGCETVAFPLISAGVYRYPKEEALRIAEETISAFLEDHDMTVYIVIFDKRSYQIGKQRFADITAYIDDHYVQTHTDKDAELSRRMRYAESGMPPAAAAKTADRAEPKEMAARKTKPAADQLLQRKAEAERYHDEVQAGREERTAKKAGDLAMPPQDEARKKPTLEDLLGQMDESFSEMLLRKIDDSGMTDAQCYKKANIDRRLFSKIRSDKQYKPSKPTAVAFAVALEMPMYETEELLKKAGYALSHSNKFDIIIEYFIRNENYNILEINEALFAFDQSLLGA